MRARDSAPVGAAECRQRLSDVLLRSPSMFGRLVALSELFDRTTGGYEHPVASEFGVVLVDRTLRQMHQEVFGEWLSLNLEQQEADLRSWLAWLGRGREQTSRLLLHTHWRLSTLLPRGYILPPARLVFIEDFQLVLCLVCRSENLNMEECRMRKADASACPWPSSGQLLCRNTHLPGCIAWVHQLAHQASVLVEGLRSRLPPIG